MNKVILIGNLGQEPELRHTQNGNAVLSLRIATTESWKDQNGDRKEQTEWHTVIMWGKRGEALAGMLKKGEKVVIEGSLQTRAWEDKDGNKRSTTEVKASNLEFIGGQRGGGGQPAERSESKGVEFGDDDIPF